MVCYMFCDMNIGAKVSTIFNMISSSSEKSRIEGIIDKINSKNAKKVALLLVIGFVCYHGILHVQFGNLTIFVKYYRLNIFF